MSRKSGIIVFFKQKTAYEIVSRDWSSDVCSSDLARGDTFYNDAPITSVAGKYAAPRVFGMAGVTPDDIDLTGSYDAFTFTTMLQLEDYGFCKKGEGGHHVSDGTIMLGGKRPNNTSGGHLCEGYTHGIAM